tara:strand:- start:4353 stop:4895 length:543 start_codon:yes stop_codon:yes gene_type:complete
MKTKVLYLGALFLIGAAAQAKTTPTVQKSVNIEVKSYSPFAPVAVIEKGIEFLIYPNGTVDFNMPRSSVSIGRRSVKEIRSNKSVVINKRGIYRPGYVRYDRAGRLIQVGKVPLFYKQNGKIAKVGNTAIQYHKGRIYRVGNIKMNNKIYKGDHNGHHINMKKKKSKSHIEYGDRKRKRD